MLRKDLDDLEKNGKTGDWCFYLEDRVLILKLDKGNETDWLYLEPTWGKPYFEWDGNKEHPTLKRHFE